MRNSRRIPKIMRFFRKNPIAFSQFIGVETEDTMFLQYKSNFENNYEDLLVKWLEFPDQRFGQLLINEGIVPDGQHWNYEESQWIVDNKWMKPEQIFLWGHLPLSYNEDMDEWESKKPKLNEKLEKWQMFPYKYLRPLDVYAQRYGEWMQQRPQYTFSFLEDLSKEHIENILKNCQVSSVYREAFTRLLEK